MTDKILYAALFERNTGEVIEVKEIFSSSIAVSDHIANGYRIISAKEAERLRPQAKGLASLTN